MTNLQILYTEYFKLITEHKLDIKVFPEIVISNRMKAKAGNVRYKYDLSKIKITISSIHLEKYGIKSAIYTLRHEVAHLAQQLIAPYEKESHGRMFKILCQKFGGKMNTKLAGSEFKECASTNYVPRREWAKRY